MKNFFLISSFVCIFTTAFSQHAKELTPGYYVVVAAFSPNREDLATNYTSLLNKRGLNAEYGFNSTRNYFYVYTTKFSEREPSIKLMLETRKQEEFAKTWVRVIMTDVAKEQDIVKAEPEMVTEVQAQPVPVNVVTEQSPPVQAAADTTADIVVTDNAPIIQYEHINLDNTEVFLSLYNATNNRIVEGDVKVIDTDKSKLIKEVKGNDYLYLPDPKSKSGQITLICEAFGYRKVQHEISYPMPLADTVKEFIDLMGTTFIINFNLVRYSTGDIGTLYHVYFFNDAAVMLPESKFELLSLLEMMQENPNYRIRLHGHTNGNYHGKIIQLGPDKNFFSLTGSKNGTGSAKDLASARAETIKEYLVANAIDPNRIEIKSWGGKKPIYDKHSANAKKNVRVEVEILSE
jgi:outer membrane protein OmpA-like peptidoglycan-associated protein